MPAPVDKLPSEILSHIFASIVQSWLYAHFIGDKSFGPTNYPILLSSVCVRWRQVAIATPSLWSYLDFDIERYPSINLRYLNLCYERSASAPLSVRFGRYDHECYLNTIDDQLASFLRAYATRLESLAISYWHSKFVKEILATLFAHGAAGPVRKLALHSTASDKWMLADDLLSQIALDQLLQPLRNLYLEGVAFDWTPVRCRNLVELQLVELAPNVMPSPSQLVELLNANPAMRRLKVTRFYPISLDPDLPPIQLSELRYLELNFSPDAMHWFFTRLTPVPHELDLQLTSFARNIQARVVDTLRDFFEQTRIISLRIYGSSWLPFSSVVAKLPHLETIGISYPGDIIYDFTEMNSQTELLPKLHTIELTRCTTLNVESGIKSIMSLASVRRILFSTFYLMNETETTLLDEGQIREWMSEMGITASIIELPQLRSPNPSPFV
jgi:hypothetical protein